MREVREEIGLDVEIERAGEVVVVGEQGGQLGAEGDSRGAREGREVDQQLRLFPVRLGEGIA